MDWASDVAIRDRALRVVRRATISAVGTVVALSGVFSVAAALTFSGKPAAHQEKPPVVPSAAAPVQKPGPAPIVITQVVRVPYGSSVSYKGTTSSGGGSVASAPSSSGAPAAAPPPPPPPACVSTPSKPC